MDMDVMLFDIKFNQNIFVYNVIKSNVYIYLHTYVMSKINFNLNI